MNASLLRAAAPQILLAANDPAAALQPTSHAQARVQVVLSRPLFAPDRRPSGAASGAGPASLSRVAGIMVSGGVRSVIFAARDGGKPLVVGEGEEVSGFRVRSIETTQVTVVGPDGPVVLRPSFDPAPRPAAATQQTSLPGLPGFGALATAAAR